MVCLRGDGADVAGCEVIRGTAGLEAGEGG